MDKRIIIIIVMVNIVAASVAIYKRALGNNAPAIHLNIDKNVINAGDSITYTDNTQGANTWKWDFGDGEPSYKPNGKHIYYDLGKHKIILTVSGPSFGPIVDSSKEIVVRAAPKPDTAKPAAPVVVEQPKPEPKPAPAPAPHKPAPKPHRRGGDVSELPKDEGPTEIKR